MLAKTQNETFAAQQDVKHVHNETAKLLWFDEENENKQYSKGVQNRKNCGAPMVAAATVSVKALFGSLGISI